MQNIVLFLVTNLGSFGISEIIHNYVNSSYVECYKNIAKKYNLKEQDKSLEAEDINREYLRKMEILRYIPFVNLILASIRLSYLKNNIKYINNHPEIFFPETKPFYKQKQEETGVIETGNKKEYYVGYFNSENKPITIYFNFDGEELNILDTSSKLFLKEDFDYQYEQVLYILYSIMTNQDKEYFRCDSIYEVFNTSLANTLLDKFDSGENTYQVSIPDDYCLTRKKS